MINLVRIKKGRLHFILFLVPLTVFIACSSHEDTLGQKSLNILKHIGTNDSMAFFSSYPTLDDQRKFASDTSLHLKHSEKILALTQEEYQAHLSETYNELFEKTTRLNINWEKVSFISETHSNKDGSKRHPPLILVDVTFADDEFDYRFRSEFTEYQDDIQYYQLNKHSLSNISKVEYVYKINKEFDSESKTIIMTNEGYNNQDEFRKAVVEDILERTIPNAKFSIHPGSIMYDLSEPNYIRSTSEIWFSLEIPQAKILESSLMGLEPSSSVDTLIKVSLEVFDDNGIKIIEQKEDDFPIYNDGSWNSLIRFDEYPMGNRDLYETVTIVLELNEKIIFSRKDSWANFVFGTYSYEKRNGKYILEFGGNRSYEVDRRNEEYNFELKY